MSIIATVGAADSDSYVTLDEANTYFSAVFNNNLWTELVEDKKERALKTATRVIDTLSFPGSKKSVSLEGSDTYQALKFPRSNTINEDGEYIIPVYIKNATCEQAMHMIRFGEIMEQNIALQKSGVKSQKIPGQAQVFSGSGSIVAPAVLSMLQGKVKIKSVDLCRA
jgi:hypothetical protein